MLDVAEAGQPNFRGGLRLTDAAGRHETRPGRDRQTVNFNACLDSPLHHSPSYLKETFSFAR
jgi:hypothetical protein